MIEMATSGPRGTPSVAGRRTTEVGWRGEVHQICKIAQGENGTRFTSLITHCLQWVDAVLRVLRVPFHGIFLGARFHKYPPAL